MEPAPPLNIREYLATFVTLVKTYHEAVSSATEAFETAMLALDEGLTQSFPPPPHDQEKG